VEIPQELVHAWLGLDVELVGTLACVRLVIYIVIYVARRARSCR